MIQKKCTKCGEWKSEEEFSWKNKAEGKRHSQCKECRRKADNERYATDEKRREAVKAVHDNQVKLLKHYVREIKEASKCAICGDERWYVLDFHHLSDKSFTISQKVHEGISLDKLKKEIEKCICVCANCHREIHYKELVKEGKIIE